MTRFITHQFMITGAFPEFMGIRERYSRSLKDSLSNTVSEECGLVKPPIARIQLRSAVEHSYQNGGDY